MDQIKPKKLGQGWDKHQVAYRLTTQRLIDLLAIAGGLPDGASPTDAITRAIELARIGQIYDCSDAVDAAHSVDASLAAGFGELKESQDRQGEAIGYIKTSLDNLHRLLKAATDGIDFDGGDSANHADPQSLSTWFSEAVSQHGGAPKRSAIAIGSLHSIKRASEKLACVDFSVELATIDAVKLPTSNTSIARLDLVNIDNPLLTATWGEPLYFVAQPVPRGWNIHIHRGSENQSKQLLATIPA